MKKTKELFKLLATMAILAIVLLMGNGMNMEAKADEKNTVIFHYQRSDGDYNNWDIYHWGMTMGNVKFSAEDSFGKIAILRFEGEISGELGFIVRLGGDDWQGKDPDCDRFITKTNFKDGIAEVWLYSAQDEFDTECPSGYESYIPYLDTEIETETETEMPKYVNVNVHYYRPDNDYTDWDVYMWQGSGYGNGITFSSEDEFGKVARSTFTTDKSLGFIVRKGDWLEKDIDGDRFIDLSKAVDGVIDIWVVSGDEVVYYDKDEIDWSKYESESETDTETTEEITTTEEKTTVEEITEEETTVEDTTSEDEKIEDESTTSDKKEPSYKFDMDDDEEEDSYLGIIVGIIAGVVALISVIVAIVVIKKK